MLNTTRWSLPYPASTDPPNGPQELHDLAVALDGVAMDDQGTLANRPVSTSGSPGKKGRYYMVAGDSVPANNGILWRDNGTGWDAVGVLFDNAVTTAKLLDGAVTSAKIADGTIAVADLAAAAALSPLDQGGTRFRFTAGSFTVSHTQDTNDSFSFANAFPAACDALVINMHSALVAVLLSKSASGASISLQMAGNSPATGSYTGDYIAIGH